MFSKEISQNTCIVCRKVFCCENCRRKHEINTHKIHPDCSICIYGKIILRDPSDSLLQHIKAKHWPLHCLYCGKMFNTIEELILYNKCPKIAPVQNDKENNNTPPISAGQSCVPTSTPLAPHEDESKFLQKMSEMITPVDTIEKKEVSNASPFTPQNEKKNEPYRKRRVTFSDTIEEIDDNRLVSVKKANYELSTPTSSRYSSYFTAEMKTPSLLSIDETDERAQNNLNESVVSRRDLVVTAENETLWESAINDGSESNEHFSIMEIMTSEEECVTYWPSNVPSTSHQTMGIWNSMTSLFKNVLQAFPITQERESTSLKRKFTSSDHGNDDNPEESPVLKKMKLTDIKCRPPIRYMQPAVYVRYGRIRKVSCAHKVTQTD